MTELVIPVVSRKQGNTSCQNPMIPQSYDQNCIVPRLTATRDPPPKLLFRTGAHFLRPLDTVGGYEYRAFQSQEVKTKKAKPVDLAARLQEGGSLTAWRSLPLGSLTILIISPSNNQMQEKNRTPFRGFHSADISRSSTRAAASRRLFP